MSNFLAIATVTAALSQILSETLVSDVDAVNVTTFRPDSNGNMPKTGVNIFLYQVTPNAAWQNADLPARRANGELIQRPRAAVDLHYLLTFYGDEGELVPQRVLGSVIRSLHAQPILTRELIRKTIAKKEFGFLIKSNLADAIELVKFTPTPLSFEDLSKLWSVYFQTPYSLSIGYQATVILIESEDSTHAALPVRARNIYVAPFRQPFIEEVRSADRANPLITSTSSIVIRGQRLRGEATQVMISGVDATSKIQSVSDSEITLKLPDELRAGVQGLQVIHPRMIGTPLAEHAGVQSNLASFVLHPTINKKAGVNPGDPDVPDIAIALPNLTVKLSPKVTQNQQVMLLLNEFDPPATRAARAYSFDSAPHNRPADPPETDTITFPIAGVATGNYLVRVQVDGADSPLEFSTGVNPIYVGPKVTI
jgi:hypothetical protein